MSTFHLIGILALLGMPQESGFADVRQDARFVENLGQWTDQVRFRAELGPVAVQCRRTGFDLRLHAQSGVAGSDQAAGAVLRFEFVAEDAPSSLRGSGRQSGQTHYLLGPQQSWSRGARSFRSVVYEEVHDGIDLVLREVRGRFRYDLLLEPGADLDSFRMQCRGAVGLEVSPEGALLVDTGLGVLNQSPPVAWEVLRSGQKRAVASRFRLIDRTTYGFEVGGRSDGASLVVDPGLEWSSYVGGSSLDVLTDIVRTPSGEWLVCGMTDSLDFPTTPGVFGEVSEPQQEGFVSLYSADGSQMIWSSYVGGSGDEQFWAVASDSSGRPVVVGGTGSAEFPGHGWAGPGWDGSYNGSGDVVAFRMAADGSDVEWRTFLGGISGEDPFELVLDPTDRPIVVGLTESSGFPIVGSNATAYTSHEDSFVAMFSADGTTLLMSTCLGGIGHDDWLEDLALDPAAARVAVVGSCGGDFTTFSGCFDPTFNGAFDQFVATIDLATGGVVAGTLLGGGGSDFGRAIDFDDSGNIVVAGDTDDGSFPVTAGSFDVTYGGRGDITVAGFDPALCTLLFSTFLGGSGDEDEFNTMVAGGGTITVVGGTNEPDFPTTLGAWDQVYNDPPGHGDLIISRLNGDASSLLYSTFFGGDDSELATAVVQDGSDSVMVGGVTWSPTLPTRPNAADAVYDGNADGFLARLELTPGPILDVGVLTGGASATLTVSELIPGEAALIGASLSGSGFGSAPPQLGGARLDLLDPVILVGTTDPADASGVATLTGTVPNNIGLQVWLQAAVVRGTGGGGSLVSNVAARTIQ